MPDFVRELPFWLFLGKIDDPTNGHDEMHEGEGQGASPGKQGGQEPRDVNHDVKGAAFGNRAVQPGHRDVYELKNVTKKNMTGINVGKNSKKKRFTLADF